MDRRIPSAWLKASCGARARDYRARRRVAARCPPADARTSSGHVTHARFAHRWPPTPPRAPADLPRPSAGFSVHGSTNVNYRSLEDDNDFELNISVDDE